MKYSLQNSFMFLVLIFVMIGTKNLNAQPIPRENVIAAYIFNFAQNIEWPDEEDIDRFHFKIITQNKRMIEELRKISLEKKIRNKPATVISEERLSHIENIQLIFVAKDKEELIREILDKIGGKNILLISEDYTDKKAAMINLFETRDQTINFEINKANIINQNLKVLPDMVLLGGTEIDVAKLYKESQDTLRFKEDQIADLQQHLDSLTGEIETRNREIDEQKVLISKQKQNILLQEEQIKNQQIQIENQRNELERLSADIKNQNDTLSRQSELLNNSKKLLEQQQSEINRGKAILAKQQSEIDDQNAAILSQKRVLDQQGSTIKAQEQVLYLLITIAILAIGLSAALFWGYKAKQRSNQQIKNLNRDLQTRAVSLEEVNKELEAFAYTVSHDLRAPLRHIDGFMELLQKNTTEVLNEKSLYYMTTILDASRRMGMMIDKLLSFSRLSRQDMKKTRVDLASLARKVIREELGPDTRSRNINWRINDLPEVSGDAAMLRMVLVNLISNAVKFTRTVQHAEIEIGRLPDSKTETITFVRDNGVGFDMTYADKLFNVFQRLHREDEFEGTGIGLANVQRIIARHGGRTWADGKMNQGATFYFSLPLA